MENIRPLEKGDLCIVVNGLGKENSPNLGKFVTVVHRVFGNHGMDHTKYGPVYTCSGNNIIKLGDAGQYIQTNQADFAGVWLKRIDPKVLKKEASKIIEKEENLI